MTSSVLGEESEDDFDWEEVEVGQVPVSDGVQPSTSAPLASAQDYYGDTRDQEEESSEKPHLEITIKTMGKKGEPKKNERAIQLAKERAVRLDCHKIHTVTLLMNAQVRNQWINDELLHARLMSLTPLALQNAFATIHKSLVPDALQRGRLFESAITRLANWWASAFNVVPAGHLTSRTFDEVQRTLPPLKPPQTPPKTDPKGKGKARAFGDDVEHEFEDDEERYGVRGERIRSEKSLMKHALMMRGTRDTSAQLFTALCRALGVPARLVVSLQSVPWQAGVGKPKTVAKKKKAAEGSTKGKGKRKAAADGTAESEEDDMEAVNIPGSPAVSTPRGRSPLSGNGTSPAQNGKGKQKALPVIRLRKSKTTAKTQRPRRERTPDPTTSAPVFWTEVFSRADARWLPIDPVRVIVNKRKAFDPTPNPALAKEHKQRPTRVENRLVYVMAFEEDGFARDVTPRYAREYGAKVAKVQQGGKGRREWWERICKMVRRPYRLQRDDLEDEELQANQMTEAMPTTMAGFKDHPLYVLARHLKREEVVEPPTEIGKFRGEPVYPRANVLELKTAENWMRQGRTVVAGAQPLKWVKQRAVTVNKKRAIELALADQRARMAAAAAATPGEDGVFAVDVDGGPNAGSGEGFAAEEGVMQGLYAEHQTELYKPPPVINGKIPKNDFGNLDLYVPTMLPAGAVHIPYKGTAKIARQLGFDYAEAVTGFEFKKRRAFPVVTGVVVAAENESAMLEAYWEAARDAEAKRSAKRQEQVIKRWTKLIHGLRIRQRLIEQYADRKASEPGPSSTIIDGNGDDHQDPQPVAGGFLTGVDDVVQPYTLPPNLHAVVEHASTDRSAPGEMRKAKGAANINVDAGNSSDGNDDVHIDGEKQGEEPASTTPDVNAEMTAEIEMSSCIDIDSDRATDVGSQSPAGAPMTMQELAQESARRNVDTGVDDLLMESEQESAPPLAAGTKQAVSERSTRSSRDGPGKSKALSTSSSTAKAAPRRTRKRARAQVEESDCNLGEEGEKSEQQSPAKKSRSRAPVPLPPVAPSSRVLRTRKPKDSSTLQQEKDIEAAYRRAIAH